MVYQKEVESGKGIVIFKGVQQVEVVVKVFLKKGVLNDCIFIRGLFFEVVGDQECSVDFLFYFFEGKVVIIFFLVVGFWYVNVVFRYFVY